MSTCLTCEHNIYRNTTKEWVSCAHPVTIKKTLRPESGDPAWVNFMTGDLRTRDLADVGDCPTWTQPAA